MTSSIRPATNADIQDIVNLSKQKQLAYEIQNPHFWKKSKNAEEVQRVYFQDMLDRPNVIMLVAEEGAETNGFIMAQINPAPPVYHIGGFNCLIDDFVVSDPGKWITMGRDLLTETIRLAKMAGAVQVVVVCGYHDLSKRKMLDQMDCSITSIWYSRPI